MGMLYSSGPQLFWHQGPFSWKTIFPQKGWGAMQGYRQERVSPTRSSHPVGQGVLGGRDRWWSSGELHRQSCSSRPGSSGIGLQLRGWGPLLWGEPALHLCSEGFLSFLLWVRILQEGFSRVFVSFLGAFFNIMCQNEHIPWSVILPYFHFESIWLLMGFLSFVPLTSSVLGFSLHK